jgi:hypothetical protein
MPSRIEIPQADGPHFAATPAQAGPAQAAKAAGNAPAGPLR